MEPETKQAYQEQVKAQLDKLNAQIDQMKAQAAEAKADAEIDYHSMVEDLSSKRDAVQEKLEEIGKASEDAWLDLKIGFETAWNDLNQAFQSAMDKF
ncbi:MAG: RAQPRD family integrative conjugative element protein [Rivularia sp. (in: cyanobacteria)]